MMQSKIFGRRIFLACACLGILATHSPSWSQGATFPTKPIRLVVAYPPGGPVDLIARFIAEPLGRAFGQPVVIENRGGAGGVIGTDYVAKAAPDGYTLLLVSTPLAIQETLNAKMPYSALRDFSPIAKVAEGPQVLLVGSNVSVRTLREFIDYAKAQNGKLNYASPSTGGANHLATELFKSRVGVKALAVPYNGNGPAEIALIGGQVDFMFSSLTSSLPQVEGGRLRALGVTSKKRLGNAPDIPAIAETVAGFEASSWFGIIGPAKMPQAIIDRLNVEINKVMEHPDMKKRLVSLYLDFSAESPAQFAEFIKQNTALWGGVIKDVGLSQSN
jgi:tripartite-type tricarboxylate transporter receptor subunit TctC